MLTIFVNIISRPYSRSVNQVHRRSFSFLSFFYIHNIDLYPNSKFQSLLPKFRFQIHVHFTISFLSLVIFTNMISIMNLSTKFIINQGEYKRGTLTCHRCSICVPLLLLHSPCGSS
jgi:hypothetical protein